MINIIWQTTIDSSKLVLNDETMGQFEYIDKVVFKSVEHTHFFDNKQYKTFLDNSIIIYSAPQPNPDVGLKKYLAKYKELGMKYMLFHLSDPSLGHNYDYYLDALHVFRVHYNSRIKDTNVTTLPLGFTTGYMNNGGYVNLSDKRDIPIVFIGQIKADRRELIDTMASIKNNLLHLTKAWGCPTALSFNEVIDIYKRTRIVPCPMGDVNPGSLRFYECLEWGCVPVIKRYNDYYYNVFGEHPIPIVGEWGEVKQLVERLYDDSELDSLILTINTWYKNMMSTVSEKVSNIINEKFC